VRIIIIYRSDVCTLCARGVAGERECVQSCVGGCACVCEYEKQIRPCLNSALVANNNYNLFYLYDIVIITRIGICPIKVWWK